MNAGSKQPNWRTILELEEQLSKTSTLDAQINLIKQSIENNLDSSVIFCFFEEEYLHQKGIPDALTKETKDVTTPLMELVVKTGHLVSELDLQESNSLGNQPQDDLGTIARRKPRQKTLAIPLKTDKKIIGVIQVDRKRGPGFSKNDIELLEGLVAQSTFAIETGFQKLKELRQAELLDRIHKISFQLDDEIDLDELATRITDLIHNAYDFHEVSIYTIEPGEPYLRLRSIAGKAMRDPAQVKDNPHDFQIKIGEGVIGSAAEKGDNILINDVRPENGQNQFDLHPKVHAEFALSLKKDKKILGVLDIKSDRPGSFLDADAIIFQTIADALASVVNNVRLYSDLKHRAEQLSSITEISNAIVSILDFDDLLNEVVFLIHRRFHFPEVRIYTVHYGKKLIAYQAGIHSLQREIPDEEKVFYLDDNEKLIPNVVQTGKSILIGDSQQNHQFENDVIKERGIWTILAMPLIFGGTVQGVLEIQIDQPNAIQQEDLPLFDALSDNIAIAIRNAGLYRSENWRRKVAESMREVAGLLTADTDLNDVLDKILTELHHSLPSDASAIWLFQENGSDDNPDESHRLALAAVHIEDSLLESLELDIDELFRYYDLSSLPNPWLIQALDSDPPMIRTAQMPYEPLGAIMDFAPDYSAIAAPLRVNDQSIGVLTLSHHSAGRYGSESQIMTSTFASYAAVAIENTRLYEAAHDQVWVSTVLLQVAEATQSLTSMDELVQTMVRITPMLLGVKGCGILTWDAVSESFEPTASEAMTPAQNDAFSRLIIRNGTSPSFDHLLDTLQTVHVIEEPENSSLNEFIRSVDTQKEAIVLFPMVAHNNILGTFLIIYDNPQTDHEFVENSTIEDKLIILQGVAHQTAIAIENINLIRAQKEEAYVSVALLQVAQAVVSLNELNDILSAVVRLTPILVGVRRCIIFLWDNENGVFHLSEEYGLTRNETQPTFASLSPEKYPILDAVRRTNNLCYVNLTPDSSSHLIWETLSTPDFSFVETFSEDDIAQSEGNDIFELALTGSNINKDFLRSKAYLMLAFPLSIKGSVLGVMITVENEMLNTFPPFPIREKRLEITTGITQQAALAIQNDMLQHEVVARERLEREFQLARDIQKAFLPEKLPRLPGWDIAVRWQPARQVSGDFYDVFELPDNKFGFVIADVADKGMPAALFMTLVRTLVRATVRELKNPSEILERVNNLLIPDMKHGMFVTIFYGIISRDTGVLTYANAGHNPPFLIQDSTKEIIKLTRSGMALGIFEDSAQQAGSTRLNPGDLLVCYTDGITEAFSETDEMFGEERLRKTILSLMDRNAASILSEIEISVRNFINDIHFSDDLTLIAIRRLPGSS